VDACEEEGGVPSRSTRPNRRETGKEGPPWWMFAGPVGEDNEICVTLDDLAREGARRMIAAALRPRSTST
jgi:hypothetical protein